MMAICFRVFAFSFAFAKIVFVFPIASTIRFVLLVFVSVKANAELTPLAARVKNPCENDSERNIFQCFVESDASNILDATNVVYLLWRILFCN
jgi:hypothetical protein